MSFSFLHPCWLGTLSNRHDLEKKCLFYPFDDTKPTHLSNIEVCSRNDGIKRPSIGFLVIFAFSFISQHAHVHVYLIGQFLNHLGGNQAGPCFFKMWPLKTYVYETLALDHCFPTFLGVRQPYFMKKTFASTPRLLNRPKDWNNWRHLALYYKL